jgi:hypothetical protein
MSSFLIHWYANSEVYAFLLVWAAIPTGFYALYLFLSNHSAMNPESEKDGTDGKH